MSDSPRLDPLILGRRLRHHRKTAGLTLDDLGDLVGKPGPYLSLLENGKKEPSLQIILELAAALGLDLQDLIEPSAPTRRDRLEIALLRAQETSLFESLDIPRVRPSAKLDNETLAHIVGLHDSIQEKSGIRSAESVEVREANGAVTDWLAARDGYLAEVEEVAADAVASGGYAGDGPFSSRNLIDLTMRSGFEIHPIDDMPPFARSIVDLDEGRIYIAQRNELKTRQARKAILQTLAGFLLEHDRSPDLETFLRQRVETAYFAAAVLVPETAVTHRLEKAKADHDLSAEDVKELFYVSYEMAAWRIVNLLTRHFDMPTHLLVSDQHGIVVKGYGNDDVPVRRDSFGGMETQRLCRHWGARVTFRSPDRFDTHHQYTDTPNGTYFCTTHVETGRDPAHAITLGVQFKDARWFRGRDTENRESSSCPDPSCCAAPEGEQEDDWRERVIVSARSQAKILGLLAPDPYPELDMVEVHEVIERRDGR